MPPAFFSLCLLLLMPANLIAYRPPSLPPLRIVEDFSESKTGFFPKNFRTFPFQRGLAAQVYTVQEEHGNLYLAAEDTREISVQIFRKVYWKLEDYPIFSWRWRPRVLPRGGNEADPSKNDSACGVYVVFGGYGGRLIKYVWSSSQPSGAYLIKKAGESYFVVKGSGRPVGWQSVRTDVLQDYREFFLEEPRQNPLGFGILTDGNATHSPAACDYDDFALSREAPQ